MSSTTDLTTYTFSAVNGIAGALGSVASTTGDDYLVNPQVRSAGRKFILINVHGERALAATTVNSVTIGGVAGTEISDGTSTLVNTAAYIWDTQALQGITTTDVVVTWSAAVTACAVGALAISNIGVFKNVVGFNLANPSTIPVGFDITILQTDMNALLITGTTCEGLETMAISNSGSVQDPSRPWMILYDQQNAEFSFGAAWTYCPQYNADNSHAAAGGVDWSGAGNGTATSLGFI